MKLTSLLQDVDKMQQAGKIDNSQKVYGVLAMYDIGNGNQIRKYLSLAICFHSSQRVGKKIWFVF